MKYVALLRGVNVGGNSMIKMAEIKLAFEKANFINVSTYINSGNILFESDEKNTEKLKEKIGAIFKEEFFSIDTVILSQNDLKKVVEDAPAIWRKDDVRKYVAFLLAPTSPKNVEQSIKLNEEVDFMNLGTQVVYMTTKKSGLTKSGYTKMTGTLIYKQMTIRNFNTVEKILNLMDKN
jgi:uncharacterized protein (DUF1697 family)